VKEWIKRKAIGFFVKTNGYISKPLFGGVGFILCFHRVLPTHMHSALFGNKGMATSPEYLDEIITYLKKNDIDIVSMAELCERLNQKKYNRRFVAFTFDDGYADNIEYGLPIFEKHKVPFIIYVSLNLPNNTLIRWWDLLELKLITNNSCHFRFPDIDLEFETKNKDQKIYAWWKTREAIISRERNLSRKQILDLFEFTEDENTKFTNSVSLSKRQISEISNNPLVLIGAHTLNHLPLKMLNDEQAAYEIIESRNQLELITGKKINHFAYPYGSEKECGLREYRMAKEFGFQTAVTFMPGNLTKKSNENMFSLPRYAAGDYLDQERLAHIINGIRHFSDNY